MHYLIVGLSHRSAPLEIREKAAVSSSENRGALGQILSGGEVAEAMLLSTCNRVEIMLVTQNPDKGYQVARDFFQTIIGISEGEISRYLYRKEDHDAILHFFRVTASLDSMVLGEPQISGQVKEAYAAALGSQATGAYLNKLVHRALHLSKRVRNETAIGQYPVSVSYAAVVLASRIFNPLNEKRVLVVGAGEMAELACQHLREKGVAKIFVANRDAGRAEALARSVKGEAISLSRLFEQEGLALLSDLDIMITSVGIDKTLVTEQQVRQVMKERKGRSMFFIDLGVPRNVEASVNRIPNVYLYTIDDLQGIVTANQKEREKEAVLAETIVAREVEKFLRNLTEREAVPTIRDLSRKFESIRTRELQKFWQHHPGATEDERKSLESLTQAIINKILHDPIISIKADEAENGESKYSDILRRLFRLEEDS
ncbi:MAG: glutamyl-tRNA reductase [Deltaproteobacteria bacterium]|nr:glutamyl-tRNA reductase [Deltaproteobacteria bacterium]MBI2500773.1 glutamyl-tRNA reductase [Deltaproteobacteria bacterium]